MKPGHSPHAAPPVNPNDRLGLTLFLAAVVHAIIILGVGFAAPKVKSALPPSLDVILVPTRSEQAPEKADFIAQANQDGGGESERARKPGQRFSAPEPSPNDGVAPLPLQASAPEVHKATPSPRLTRQAAEHRVRTDNQRPSTELTVPRLSARVIQQDAEVARLTAEINQQIEAHAKRPRKKFVHARTREVVSAAYMHDWVRRVERVGNLNYPDEARRRRLSGSLVLVVGINADGSIYDVMLRDSSGSQVLDDAARRIVELAAPFLPFPVNLREETDILFITRTWKFLSDHSLSGS